MSITFDGIEWDYDNLNGITYSSETLLEPYNTWFYLITEALNYEKETILTDITDSDYDLQIHKHKDLLIKVTDLSTRNIKYFNEDSVTLNDSDRKTATNSVNENIYLTEESTRKLKDCVKEDISYLLDECRYIQTDDSTGVTTTVEQTELSGAITLFDFELNDGLWNETYFDSWCESNCPVNYNDLRPFIPGEYEYKDAYAGFRLSMPPTNGRYGVVNSTVYVDVEDTVEKGTAEAAGGGLTTVEFSKRFYTSPQIMTSLIYTTENCYIEVPEVTTEHFKFGLKSISTGNYLAGEINWLADGY